MNETLEFYKYNIVAAEKGQYKVLARDKWAFAFLRVSREVSQQQAKIDALLAACKEVLPTFYGLLMNRYGNPDDWPQDRQGPVMFRKLKEAIAKAEA